MQHSSDFPSFYLFLRAGLKPAVFFLVATLLCASSAPGAGSQESSFSILAHRSQLSSVVCRQGRAHF